MPKNIKKKKLNNQNITYLNRDFDSLRNNLKMELTKLEELNGRLSATVNIQNGTIENLKLKINGVEQERDELSKKLSDYKPADEFKNIQDQLEDAYNKLEKLNELLRKAELDKEEAILKLNNIKDIINYHHKSSYIREHMGRVCQFS